MNKNPKTIDEFTSSKFISNNKKSRLESAKNGIQQGPAPFGYKNTKRNGLVTIIPDPNTYNIVKDLFKFYSENPEVRRYFTISDFILEKYDIWIPITTINIILLNKFYIGFLKNNEEYFKHNYETFISESLFNKVQKIIGQKKIEVVLVKNVYLHL